MREGQKLWTRNELILVINLYNKLSFGQMSSHRPEIKEMAELLGRTANSVALKLVNFSSLDPTLRERGIKGMGNVSKLDQQIWDEFYDNWENALIESEELLAARKHTTIEELNDQEDAAGNPENEKIGIDKQRLVFTRVGQSLFRKMVLAAYGGQCCITGIDETDLLVASHIVPWSQDKPNRLRPTNGLCLNALHDRAFEKHLMTVSATDFTIQISSRLKRKRQLEIIQNNFLKFDGKTIHLPDKAMPSTEQLKKHNDQFIQ